MEVVELARDSLNPELSLLGRAAQPRRHAHRPLARGARLAEGALRRAGVRHRRARLDRLRGVGRAGDARSSTIAPTSAPTTSRSPAKCWRGCRASRTRGGASRGSARRLPRLAARRRRRPAARTGPAAASPSPRSRRAAPRPRAGLLVEAPHEHRRSGAGDRRPERSELARARRRARTSAGTGRARWLLVQAVLQAAREQIPVAVAQAERQQGAVRDVEHGVRERHLLRAAPRAPRACAPPARARRRAPRGRSAGRSGPPGRRRRPRSRRSSAAATLSG